MSENPEYTVSELRDMLRTAELAERDRAYARRASVKPIMEFRAERVISRSSFDRMYDDSCQIWRLSGKVPNRTECEAVGATVSSDGGMNFVFNTLSGKLVCGVGGGTTYGWTDESFERVSEAILAMQRLPIEKQVLVVTDLIERKTQ